jgi:hypothetical protein
MVRKISIVTVVICALILSVSAVMAQSGHFLTGGGKAPTCSDTGTTLTCTATVAGLGGTTFEIRVVADGIASVTCTNPGGNVAPGQNFSFGASGSTGQLPTTRNGRDTRTVSTTAPSAPANSCPNSMWTASVTDVSFTNIRLELWEDGNLSDTFVVS